MTTVSVVTTVRNEAGTIDAFLSALLAQSRRPDEIVVVDGGSTDGTAAVVAEYERDEPAVRLLHAPRSTIARGRNTGIAAAHGSVIAVTDAGTVPAPDWLARLVAPLDGDGAVDVASGYFVPGGATWLGRCLTAVITPHVREVNPASFLPSSRSVAFRRECWERVGGYPEWLRHSEDVVFDLSLREAGAAFRFVPDAVVEWHGRRTIRGFFRQYFDYARGDGRADLWPGRHLARYSAYAAGLLLVRLARREPTAALFLAAGVLVHVGPVCRRLWRHYPFASTADMAAATALAPVIVVVGDVAKMAGYPVGRLERWRSWRPGRAGGRRRGDTG